MNSKSFAHKIPSNVIKIDFDISIWSYFLIEKFRINNITVMDEHNATHAFVVSVSHTYDIPNFRSLASIVCC